MGGQIVPDDDVARAQGWCERLLHKNVKNVGIRRGIDCETGPQAIERQGADQRRHFPVSERHGAVHAFALRRTPLAACHRAGHTTLIDKDEMSRIEFCRLFAPGFSLLLIRRPVALCGVERLFLRGKSSLASKRDSVGKLR